MTVEHLRERWGSGAGFMLATLGSSLGLGNVWRFSCVAGENGGGAFLLVYLTMVLVASVPLLLGEFALGRSTQRESAAASEALAPASRWRHLGLLGAIVAGLILAYFGVVIFEDDRQSPPGHVAVEAECPPHGREGP